MSAAALAMAEFGCAEIRLSSSYIRWVTSGLSAPSREIGRTAQSSRVRARTTGSETRAKVGV